MECPQSTNIAVPTRRIKIETTSGMPVEDTVPLLGTVIPEICIDPPDREGITTLLLAPPGLVGVTIIWDVDEGVTMIGGAEGVIKPELEIGVRVVGGRVLDGEESTIVRDANGAPASRHVSS